MKQASFVGFIFITVFVFLVVAFASNSVFTVKFNPQDLIFEKVEGYDRVGINDVRFSAAPGNPLLPAKFVQIAIPTDVEVEKVEVISFQRRELAGTYKIYPAQPPLPLFDLPTKRKETTFVQPNTSVYTLSSEYPGILARVTNNGFLGGQHIAGVALYPLQYIPSEGKLILYTQIEFKLVFRPASHFPAPVNNRSESGASFYSNLVKSIVINPEEVRLETKGLLPQEEEVEYLIITGSSLVSTFQPLADWKIRKGISTEIKDMSWVTSHYSGYDTQEKIRNCIRDYYANHGTRWVLLGGDTPILPHRMAPVMGEDIPCDLYFSDLDSNWDANGNHVYGEYEDSVDIYPDVFVGRAPSSNVSQAQIFVNKCLTYETNPPTDYQNRILYAAEVVWEGTDAAECKNYIDTSFVPSYFQDTKLYESSGNLTWANFRDGLNQGQNIINHNGHGDFNIISIGPDVWTNQDMDTLHNSPRFSLFYTFACITAAIDTDCLGEHFINNTNGGGMAYCGNTRFGWGTPGEPLHGPGAEFDIEFFRALFDNSNYQVGKTLGNSKIPFIPVSSDPTNGDSPYYRWTMFTLLLLGDPTLDLWTRIPTQLSVAHSPVTVVGMNYFEVNVVQDNALVCCVKDGEIIGTAYSTGGGAIVYFNDPLTTLGTMYVTVTKHDYMPYRDTVAVIPLEGAYVIYHSHQIDDSLGNNNGAINPGETVRMPITVKNMGTATAHSVSAKLRGNDAYVMLTDSIKSFGNINSGMTATSIGSYIFQVNPLCPDSHLVKFTLEVTSNESTWTSSFFEMVLEPDIIITTVPNTTMIHQGDSTSIKLIFTPVGGFNWQVTLTHSALPPGAIGFLNPGQLVPPDSSVFRIFTTSSASPGIHPITITAIGGGITREKEVVLGIIPPPYYGPVWHISPNGHDLVGNGSMEYPFRTIQKGINSASARDTVLAEKGRYVENIDFIGKAILVASRFIFDGLEATIDSTIIDGNSSGSVVRFNSREDSNSVIRGFTLTGGYAYYGGGVYCDGSSPTIAENFLVGNACQEHHGGPAIYCYNGSNPKIYRNLICHSNGAAAIFLYVYCNAQVINNTVCDNSWGGLSIQYNSHALVKNNIFCNNVSYGLHAGSDCTADIAYNDVYGQDHNYYDGLTDQTGINGNISVNPLFVDPSVGDYHLSLGSPCINAGDPTDSIPYGGGARIDIGAFESLFQGPWVTYHSHRIDDSAGNNNGGVNPGEVIAMPITAKNYGTETAYGVSGTLRTDDSFIVVTDSIKTFGNIGVGMTAVSVGNYSFEVDSLCPDTHQVNFTMEMTDGSSIWTSYFTEMVADTGFALTAVPDSVVLKRGEQGDFKLTVTSLGGFRSLVGLSYSQLSPGVSGQIQPDHLVPTDTSVFRINIAPDAAFGTYSVTVTATGGGITHEKELIYNVMVRGDCNGDGLVNLADIVFLINYLFRGGPPPSIPQAGDANCDGRVNLVDLVYLINYIFRSGPAPSC